ncbi:unnamed protein product [Paramecium primaurelia]|uniref:Histidine kinase n=1 Tax=Paramecium primaurelia TaxID=5886 RepID=A0A8S1M5S1_PARPR|nr:unnamed protein product [Paramecium primaurelia]
MIQILVTYTLHIEIQIPQFSFAHSLFYAYLMFKNQIEFWILSINILFIGLYCILRQYDYLDQQVIWSTIHYAIVYIILTILNYDVFKQQNLQSSPKLIELISTSERYRWKEMSQCELFQDNYTKNMCFNQIREGVILYEQGYEKPPTFINRSAKQMFQISDENQIQIAYSNYCRIERMEPKRSIQSIKSIGIDMQNSQKQYSESLSFNSKQQSQYIPQQGLKEITLLQMLDKIWQKQNKESYLFYVQQSKHLTQSQQSPILEVSVYLNSQVRKVMTLICRDLSYKKYIKQLQSHYYQKSKMISFVSHEFRAPLGCMITMLEHVAKEQNNLYIQNSIDNSKYLLNLCNDLLDLAQIQANKFQLKKERFNLKMLCQECLQMFNLQAEKKQLKLMLQYDSSCPDIIEQDQNRIKQVLINLIGNAFKFTQEGQILLRVELIDELVIEISISDSGIGVQEQDKEMLMKAFGKINSEESKKLNAQGVGLGLVISNKIAQQLGDGLRFESIYHKGSSFSFTIHLDNIQSYESEIIKSVNKKQSTLRDSEMMENLYEDGESSKEIQIIVTQPKKLMNSTVECCSKVLIVDDTQFNIDTLQMLLIRIGINQIDYSINGYKAIEKVKLKEKCNQCNSNMYQLIFMDLEMLGINGINASKLIFSYCEEKNIKPPIIVACSGYQKDIEFPKCQQVGMKFYLEKPVDIRQLQSIIDYYRSTI